MTKRHLLDTTAVFSPPTEAAAAAAEAPKASKSAQSAYQPEKQSLTSAVSRKGRPQAPRAPPPTPQRQYRGAYSIAEFCEAHSLSVPMFYKLRAKGEAPDVMKVGTRTLISVEAADRWRRARERATRQLKKQTAS